LYSDNIKADLKNTEREDVDWIRLHRIWVILTKILCYYSVLPNIN
jgi:hypothetical protein